MSYKRVLTIQDISCFGQCSLTVALPIISAMGVETAVLPSVVLSTHTGGFEGFTFHDLTDDFPAISAHWKKEGILFDAFYTGYLGSVKQIEYVKDVIAAHSAGGAQTIIDPVLGDYGRMYHGFDERFTDAMRGLVSQADVVLPNITEGSLLTGMEYREAYDEAYIREMILKIVGIGAKKVVLTGVTFRPDTTGVMVYENGAFRYYEHRRIAKNCHGTGDIIASAFTGALMRGLDCYESAQVAADFTLKAIEHTLDAPEHWYGVRFEMAFPFLIERLAKALK